MSTGEPSTRTRLFFWFILGSLSVFFAEVVSGSQIYAFFVPVNWLLVFPLYTLHTLTLWTLVFRYGRGRLYALFPAGAIFGLYEAYITKVIWSPPWNENPIMFGGVAVVETLLLVLFWHAFMAFIVPLFIAETGLTSSREILGGLPLRVREFISSNRAPRLVYILVFMAGAFQSVGSPTPLDSLASGLTSSAFVAILVFAWKRKGGEAYSFRDLLPSPGIFKTLLVLLASDYLILGALLRPEMQPGLTAQATVIIMYVFFGLLLRRGLSLSRLGEEDPPSPFSMDVSSRRMVFAAALFTAGSVVGNLMGVGFAVAVIVWVGGMIAGLTSLGYTIARATNQRLIKNTENSLR
jgi:hypothetical protein